MRVGLALALLVAIAGAGPARAQHDAADVPAQAAEGCAMCHASHRAARGPYALKGGDVGPGWGRLASVALGGVSQSCLRCHETPEGRARQPEYGSQPTLPLQSGTYLGPDPADSHVLGRLDRSGAGSSAWRLAGARPDRRPATMSLLPPGDEGSALTCTTCHDPHRRDSSLPGAEEQRRLCGSCHDPASYETDDHAVLTCSDCHTLHGARETTLIAARSTEELCRSCHDPAVAVMRELPDRLPVSTAAEHLRSSGGSCGSCHAVHR